MPDEELERTEQVEIGDLIEFALGEPGLDGHGLDPACSPPDNAADPLRHRPSDHHGPTPPGPRFIWESHDEA